MIVLIRPVKMLAASQVDSHSLLFAPHFTLAQLSHSAVDSDALVSLSPAVPWTHLILSNVKRPHLVPLSSSHFIQSKIGHQRERVLLRCFTIFIAWITACCRFLLFSYQLSVSSLRVNAFRKLSQVDGEQVALIAKNGTAAHYSIDSSPVSLFG